MRTTNGTLLAFAEGRVLNCGDAADIDIVLKRSTDGGRTWGPLQVVTEGAGDTHGNPAPIVDRETGRILLAETYNTGRTDAGNCSVPCDRTPHLQYSDDDGRTWSEPRDLSDEILPGHWNSWYATGPVHGIQLTRGKHAGRLVFGVNTETWNGSRVSANHAALIVSDDGGDHWRVGATDSWPIAAGRHVPAEAVRGDAHRTRRRRPPRQRPGAGRHRPGHRSQTVSRNGGDSFATPVPRPPGPLHPAGPGRDRYAWATGCCCPLRPTPTAAGR